MKLNYDILGNHIQLVDRRNSELITDKVLGINIDKFFMPSVANIIGTDLSRYKLLMKNSFACNPMHVGRDEKLPVALYKEDTPAIVSPAYFMFEIKKQSSLIPEFLMMWFKRREFDRSCWYHTDGSVRGGITWEEICRLEVPILSKEEQLTIIDSYNVIADRITLKKKINDNLQQQAFSLYREAIAGYMKNAQLSDIADITMGTSPEGESLNTEEEGIVFYQGKTDFGFRFPTVRQYTTEPQRYAQEKDILMSVRAPVGTVNISTEKCAIGRGLAAIHPKDKKYSYLFYTMIELDFELNKFNDEGTVFGSITKDDLHALAIVDIDEEEKIAFEQKASIIDAAISSNELEIVALKNAASLLLSKITD